ANRVTWKVVDVDELRLPLRLPFLSGVLEVPDELLLLGVDGDEGNAAIDAVLRLLVDVLELHVPIGMLLAFDRLLGSLETVAVLGQHLGYRFVANPNAVLREHLRSERRRV